MDNEHISEKAKKSNQLFSNIKKTIGSPGQPLDSETRSFMEPRFAYDFSRVKIHASAEATDSAAGLNARAYTFGNSIVFGQGEYKPGSNEGRSLIAHELAHIVQQGSSDAGINDNVRIGTPDHPSEKFADLAAQNLLNDNTSSYRSTALQIRHALRSSAIGRPVIQRQVKTWAGEFDPSKYKIAKDPGLEGAEIELKFTPNEKVNAELIGMVQTARSLVGGKPVNTKIFGKAGAKTLKERTIPAGKPGAGTRVDQFSTQGNPLYATIKESPGDTLAKTPTDPFWGKHGMRYTDKTGKPHKEPAILKDTAQLPTGMKNTSQTFETTALAVKGVQTGMYYGSVQWGWEKGPAGKVSLLPFKLVSTYFPSATFGKAIEKWNISKTAAGKKTIDLPVIQDFVTLYGNPADVMLDIGVGEPIPRGSTIRVLDDSDILAYQVVVLDGPMIGRTGYVSSLEASHILTVKK